MVRLVAVVGYNAAVRLGTVAIAIVMVIVIVMVMAIRGAALVGRGIMNPVNVVKGMLISGDLVALVTATFHILTLAPFFTLVAVNDAVRFLRHIRLHVANGNDCRYSLCDTPLPSPVYQIPAVAALYRPRPSTRRSAAVGSRQTAGLRPYIIPSRLKRLYPNARGACGMGHHRADARG